MKKIIYSLIFIFVIFLVSGCSFNNKINTIFKNIEINENECEIEKDIDTHDSFHGDGDYFAKIKCNNINYNELSKNWKKLPLSESIKQATEIEHCNDNECKSIYDRFSIPNIENGYYYFIDRHNESKNKYDDTDLNNRSSYNYTLAIIDLNTNIIYYYEFDT